MKTAGTLLVNPPPPPTEQVTWVPEGHLITTVSAQTMFKDVSVGMAMQGAGDAPMTQSGAEFNVKTTNDTTGGSWGETSYLVPQAPSGVTSLDRDWEGGEWLDPNDHTLRNGKKFYSRSFRGGGGRGGHEEGGGARGYRENRWRGERRGVGGYRGVGRRDNREGFREQDRGDRKQEGRGGDATSKGQNVRGRGRSYHYNQQQSNGREAGYSSGMRNPPYTDL
ncbi:protein lingerer-like [Oncorhynchus tshawytscha]|uniref:protein lingerer-like n=1 Tax=Oncorhynchus tshawytscha TaxID=74940 RepID=UPI001C3DDC34|nr:protein lingerer-like [Oncorhynchus tshawytscha]XP_042183941.1 protein lingerer-like [Oncorhynchus tshawytscha]XP_042183942.1 protein lingerer-like [Oncorhynchus tshawytscha]